MKKYKWDKEEIEDAVQKSYSFNETLRQLSIKTTGNNGATLKRKIKEYGIDISHFTFHPTTQPKLEKPVEFYLSENSSIQTSKLKEKLLKYGYKENKCEICGCSEWMGKPLNCQLHHINGVNTDNRLENLQLLCPNCHSQTDNYCGSANKTEKAAHYCKECGRPLKSKNSIYCLSCSLKKRRKIEIDKETLIMYLKKYNCNRVKVSKEIGVSETSIRKWCKKFGLPTSSKELKDFLK